MTYAEFTTLLEKQLWREGDDELRSVLPQMINLAESKLRRVFWPGDNKAVETVTFDGETAYSMPDDYRAMDQVLISGVGEMTYDRPGAFFSRSGDDCKFTLVNRDLYVSTIGEVTVVYHRKIPDFQATDESWVADDYTDLYMYCALSHAGLFVRDHQMVQVWTGEYMQALAEVDDAADKFAYPSRSPLKIRFGGR